MFATFKIVAKDSKGTENTYYSNSTWVNEEARNKIFEVYNRKSYFSNGFAFLTFYGLIEAVNRVPLLYKFPLLHRIGFVAVPTLIVKLLSSHLYDSSNESTIRKLLEEGNTPFWKNPKRVPELNRVYFELDDTKNFEPNILHHGLSESQLDGFYPDLVLGKEEEYHAAPAAHGHH